MTPKTAKPRFEIIVEDTPCPVPADNRLRRLLKALLRGYGFRCVSVRDLPAPPAEPKPPADAA